jgi:hypothetical protein
MQAVQHEMYAIIDKGEEHLEKVLLELHASPIFAS